MSPLQTTHVDDVESHTGCGVGHVADVVHCTQVLVVVLHAGVAPLHCALVVHATQRPVFGPVVAQIVDRHSVAPLDPVQGPSPFA